MKDLEAPARRARSARALPSKNSLKLPPLADSGPGARARPYARADLYCLLATKHRPTHCGLPTAICYST